MGESMDDRPDATSCTKCGGKKIEWKQFQHFSYWYCHDCKDEFKPKGRDDFPEWKALAKDVKAGDKFVHIPRLGTKPWQDIVTNGYRWGIVADYIKKNCANDLHEISFINEHGTKMHVYYYDSTYKTLYVRIIYKIDLDSYIKFLKTNTTSNATTQTTASWRDRVTEGYKWGDIANFCDYSGKYKILDIIYNLSNKSFKIKWEHEITKSQVTTDPSRKRIDDGIQRT